MQLVKDGNQITTVEEWFQFARPRGGTYQWRDGYSAKELAKAWCTIPGNPTPPAVFSHFLNLLPFPGLTPLVGFPEHRIHIDHLPGEPRNADLVVLCESGGGNVVVSIEAKAREPFGETIAQVVNRAAERWLEESRSNYLTRLEGLYRALFFPRREGARCDHPPRRR